jgi:hypothetical protein
MSKGYIEAAGLYKIFDQVLEDMPDVPWENQFKNYVKAVKKMASNLERHEVKYCPKCGAKLEVANDDNLYSV